jgi:hypothetical protein
MAANSSSHPARAGFNQSGGAYFVIISSIAGQLNAFTAGTGSGGATTAGTFAPVTTLALLPGAGNQSSLFGVGNLIKDLGKTVVSSGRTFRKFQLSQAASQTSSVSNGVAGVSPTYASFYLETGRDGADGAAGAGGHPIIARYF